MFQDTDMWSETESELFEVEGNSTKSGIPWNPWLVDGISYQLISVDVQANGFSALFKVSPDLKVPPTGVLGAIDGMVLETGSLHERPFGGAPEDRPARVFFAAVCGPLIGYNEDGAFAAVCDAKSIFALAKSQGCVAHVLVNDTVTPTPAMTSQTETYVDRDGK